MQRNRKLTGVIGGRAISGMEVQGALLTVRFDDGSVMTVRTGGGAAPGAAPGRVRAVRQGDTTLILDLDDGSSLELHTAEATSCVMVRSGTGAFEYSD